MEECQNSAEIPASCKKHKTQITNKNINIPMEEKIEIAKTKKKKKKKSKSTKEESALKDKNLIASCLSQKINPNINTVKNINSTNLIKKNRIRKRKKLSKISSDALENKRPDENSNVGLSSGMEKKTSLKSTGKTIPNQPSTSSDEKKRTGMLLQCEEINKMQAILDKKWPNLGLDNKRIEKEQKRILKEKKNYERFQLKYFKQKEKQMYDKWQKENKSFQLHKKLGKNNIQRSNSVGNNTVQMNNLGINKENDLKKKTKIKQICVQDKVKTKEVVRDKNKSKEMLQVSNTAPKRKSVEVRREEFENLAYKIHGLFTSSSDSNTDSGPEDFDEAYYLLKPPPIDYELIKDNIVEIPTPCEEHIKQLNIPMEEKGEMTKVKKRRKRKSKSTKKENYLNPIDSQATNTNINAIKNNCDTTLIKDTVRKRKKKKSSGKATSNQPSTTCGSDEERRTKELLECDIEELKKIEKVLDKIEWPTIEQSEKEIVEETNRLLTRQGEIYRKLRTHTTKSNRKYLKEALKELYEKWLEEKLSAIGHKNLYNNKVQQSNSIGKKAKKCATNSENVQGKVKTKEVVSDKNKSKEMVKVSNTAPKKKLEADRHKVSDNNKVQTNNKVPDSDKKYKINSITCHQNSTSSSILVGGFDEYMQNVLNDRRDIYRPSLSNSYYNEIYKDQVINDKKKENSQLVNNTGRKVTTRPQEKLKEEDIRCHYYEYSGQNFQSYMEFREIYLCTSLGNIPETKETRKNKIARVNDVIRNTSDETLKDDIRCYYYDYPGQNFQSYMEYRDIHLDTSLGNIPGSKQITQEARKNEIAEVNDAVRSTFNETLKNYIRCHHYDYLGQNFQSYMEFRDIYLYMSLGNLPESKQTTRKNKIAGVNDVVRNTSDKRLKDDIRYCYYDYPGQNFQSYMEYRDIHLDTSLGNIPGSKQITQEARKNEIAEVNDAVRSTFNETLKNYIRCHHYDYLGQNFQSYMEFRDIYLYMSLGNLPESKQTTRKNKIAGVNDVVRNTSDKTLKDDIRCYYYDYPGQNFQSYMEFRDVHLYKSLGNIPESNQTTEATRKNKISGVNDVITNTSDESLKDDIRCYYYDYPDQNFQSYMEFRDVYLYMSLDKIPERKQNRKGRKRKNRKNIAGDKNITTNAKCDTIDIDKVNDNFQDYNILPKKSTNVESNYELFLKVIRVIFILLIAYITKVILCQYFLCICLILVDCFLIFVCFYKI